MQSTLANPTGANKTVPDFTLGVDNAGELVTPEVASVPYRANAAVTKGQALMFVAPTTTVPISVTPMTAAGATWLYAGVALNAAAAGGIVQVVTEGHCLINVGAGTAAAASYALVPETTTGVFDVDDALDAGDNAVGVFWGVKDANNLAFAYVNRSGLPQPFVVNT